MEREHTHRERQSKETEKGMNGVGRREFGDSQLGSSVTRPQGNNPQLQLTRHMAAKPCYHGNRSYPLDLDSTD